MNILGSMVDISRKRGAVHVVMPRIVAKRRVSVNFVDVPGMGLLVLLSCPIVVSRQSPGVAGSFFQLQLCTIFTKTRKIANVLGGYQFVQLYVIVKIIIIIIIKRREKFCFVLFFENLFLKN